jgi:hypothetical protein
MAGAVGATMTLTACGGGGSKSSNKGSSGGQVQTSGGSPSAQVDSAISKLGSASSIEMALSLPISPSDLQKLSDTDPSSKLTTQEAQAITSGSFFVIVGSGNGKSLSSAKTDPNNSLDVGVTTSGDTPFEVRYVGQNIYLHVQISKLLSDAGQDPSKASSFTSEAGQLDTYVPGLSALIQGNWVEISHSSLQALEAPLKNLENQFGGSSGSSSSSSVPGTPSLQQELQLESQVLGALKSNSTITSLGSSNGRQGYSVTVQVANFLKAVGPQIESTFSTIPKEGQQIQKSLQQAESQLPPGQTATADVYISNGSLSEIDIDLNQFDHKQSFAIPLRISLSSPGAPSAPSGATPIDTSKLPSLLSSGGL